MNSDMLEKYLVRVGLLGRPKPTETGMRQLHYAQHRTIPFENFDVILGREIKLSEEAIFQKLVTNNRGGYCFELNGIMLSVLQTLGFEARSLLGRVHLSGKATGRSHQVTLVIIEGQKWLVDVGFGSQTPRSPLPIELDKEFSTDLQTYRFRNDPWYGFMLQIQDDNEWVDLYSLDMGFVCDGDIDYGNYYTSTSSNSVFTSSCIASLPIQDGIITLLNNKLKIQSKNGIEEITLLNERLFFQEVEKNFGLNLSVPFSSIAKCF